MELSQETQGCHRSTYEMNRQFLRAVPKTQIDCLLQSSGFICNFLQAKKFPSCLIIEALKRWSFRETMISLREKWAFGDLPLRLSSTRKTLCNLILQGFIWSWLPILTYIISIFALWLRSLLSFPFWITERSQALVVKSTDWSSGSPELDS